MKRLQVTLIALAGGLMIAWAAFAATTPAKPEKVRDVRVIVNGHEVPAPGAGEFLDDDGDEDGAMAFDDDTPGGADRRVIVRRFQHGPGGMAGGGLEGLHGRRMGHGGAMMMHARMAERLHLTDEQRTRIRDLHERQMRRGIQARADLQLARMDLHKLMRAPRPELTAINSQIDRMARMRADLAKSRVATMMESRAVLTPEQQKQMREMRMHPGAMPGGGAGGRGEMRIEDAPDSQ